MLEIRNIAFSYRNKPVLRDVSFVISPGEAVCLLGDNGAGKTTLLRILSTLLVPEKGHILLDGQDALIKSLHYRNQLGYLSETPVLDEDMTVRGYLEYRAALKGEISKRIRRRVGDAIEVCKLTDIYSQRISTLSVGQKKCVALADAVLLRPRVLLLDDFLASLDSRMREAASSILTAVASFSNVIVTGHEISDLAKWATRFLILRDGVISSTITASGVQIDDLQERISSALRGDN